MTAILVTGGAGYIGSHTCKQLAQSGYQPVVLDNLVYGHPWAVKWGPLEAGDVGNRTRLDEVFHKYRPAAVLHFAAYAYVGESVIDPAKYYRNNVSGSLTLLETMRDHRVGKIVLSSTCATYGTPKAIPITEEHPQDPINPYGASKLMVEQMLKDFYEAYGLSSVSLRYFNAAGADPQGELGEDHTPETHLIPLVLDAAIGRRPSITVYGEDYPTPDGTCIRDYIHVTDLAQAHVLALQKMERSASAAFAYNLGNGQGFSVKQVIETAREVTSRDIPTHIGPRRSGDPPRLIADATKAKGELDWCPKYTELPQILETAWRWVKQRP
jgi:UDP-arabinose 4-epimerase